MDDTKIELDSPEAIRAAGIKIPPCPQVLVDLQQVLHDPDSGNQTIARLIGRDIKLASVVFKTVNSVVTGPGRKQFNTIDQAITVLGRQAIENIVKTEAIRLSLGGPDKRLARFWDRSMDIAMLCSIIADKVRSSHTLSQEQAFTAGLFHDCGVAVLIQHFPDYCEAFTAGDNCLPDVLREDMLFHTSHCAIGQMVASEWSLPEFVYETIRCHHLPLTEISDVGVMATATLLMATHIANESMNLDDTAWPQQRDDVINQLGLSLEGLDAFEREVWSSFEVLH